MTFTLETKNSATSSFESRTKGVLLTEAGDNITTEDGFDIQIEGGTTLDSAYSLSSKNISTTSYETKH